ncbi:MAG: hypothetical protein DUD39_11480 [Coriobacteriaceae bacterium]|nr:MAG: hypothetical protein DUD39_11480 [Coriobacteriaceae bacterium]
MPVKPLAFVGESLDALFMRAVNDQPIEHFTLRGVDSLIGGVNAGRLVIISGEPGAAKTTLLGQLADDLASKGHPVLFFTFELAPQALLAKSLVRLIDSVSIGDLSNAYHDADSATKLENARETYRKRAGTRLAYIDRPCSPVQMGRYVADCEKETGLKPVVMLDYLQICESSTERAVVDERVAIKETVMGLRDIANAFDVPVFAISSINRTSYEMKPTLKSLGGCSFIAYSADTVLHLAVESKSDERERNLGMSVRPLVLTALKNRYSVTGAARLDFEPSHALFRDHLEDYSHGWAR